MAGMNLFDAVGYGFASISTGGFGTHDSSFEYFNSYLIDCLAIFFVLLGSINFSLHFVAFRKGSIKHYWQDPECKALLWLWLIAGLLVAGTLISYHVYQTPGRSLVEGFFSVTSFFTTTGFFSADFVKWPTFLPFLLLFLSILGGCSGSTAGGIKIIRLLLLKKQAGREIQRLIHPNGHYVIKLGHRTLHHKTLDAIWAFFFIFIFTFVVLLLLLLATDLDFLTAFSALGCCISNTGIGLGAVAENFKTINDPAKVILSIAMLAGRLELFTLIVLFSPSYWRN
jgi:trk system potassium uptake protein TrkH